MTHDLRKLILEAAAAIDGLGPLEESIKWGQPSFAPQKRNIGSSVRIQEGQDGTASLMFICHTNLVDEFRELYGDRLTFEGNRAIIVDLSKQLPREELKHCIALALTYKKRKRGRH